MFGQQKWSLFERQIMVPGFWNLDFYYSAFFFEGVLSYEVQQEEKSRQLKRKPLKWYCEENKPKEGKLLSCYKHLTIKEREKIYEMLILGAKIREIARELERNPRRYSPSEAQQAYEKRRKKSVRKHVLSDADLNSQVRFFLGKMYWSPEQISHRLRKESKNL